ncbi:MAG: hypothetical protein K5756_05545 [Clostridiales bacterium]|nr:hypothetical protein [Clostridiales bacterium]
MKALNAGKKSGEEQKNALKEFADSNLNEEQITALGRIMNNPEEMKKMLESQAAKKLIERLKNQEGKG